MKILQLTGLLLAAGSFTAATLVAVKSSRAASEPSPAAAPHEAGILRYATDAPQLAALKIKTAEELPVPLAEPLNGRITYNENFTARVSSPIAGRIVSLRLQPGDAVRAGDALLALDSPELAQAVADQSKAQADETRKRLALERAQKLHDGEVLPRKDLESAEADLAQARAEAERARLRLRNLAPAGGARENYVLHSPISGVVTERRANPGLEVRPDLAEPLYVITDPARLWVMIDLPERNLSKVEPGHPVAVEVDAWPGERFPGTIEKVGETVDAATRRIQVRCSLPNPARRLKPEMYARVTLLADEQQRALRVPNGALITEGLYSHLFVERSAGVFEKRRVSLRLQDRDFSYVASGLNRGERVVASGALLLNSELGDAK
ncbi:MAG: efflux RND transporter periplasmic adaptor subunit [Proteobacteria bacterium]|nr:efflux RND transporter periplasmic adaptor subunit [Pseudomonadota bacterium]